MTVLPADTVRMDIADELAEALKREGHVAGDPTPGGIALARWEKRQQQPENAGRDTEKVRLETLVRETLEEVGLGYGANGYDYEIEVEALVRALLNDGPGAAS